MKSKLNLSELVRLEKLMNQQGLLPLSIIEEAMNLIRSNPETGTLEDQENDQRLSSFKVRLAKKLWHRTDLNAEKAIMELLEIHHTDLSKIINRLKHCQIDSKEIVFSPTGLIGQGGYSKVYLGEYKNNPVAIKAYALAENDYLKSLKDRYLKEIGNLIVLHEADNIIEIHGLCIIHIEHETLYCIAMEYASRGALDLIIKKNPELLEDWAIREKIILGIIKGLECIHAADLVHADLKSANVLITNNFDAKIADLNLSGKSGSKIGGTMPYKSPNVLNGECNTEKDDIFSLGLVIAEIIILESIKSVYPEFIFFNKQFFLFDDIYVAEFLKNYLLKSYRPIIPENKITFKQEMLLGSCWEHFRELRPHSSRLLYQWNLPDVDIFHGLKWSLRSMLTIACKFGQINHVKELLCDRSNSINQIYHDGCTPLMAACASSRTHRMPELFELLLKKGADLFFVNKINGKTALDFAFQHHHETAIELLLASLRGYWQNYHAHASHDFEKPAMSLETLALAREWVQKNSLQGKYTDAFFAKLQEIIEYQIESNKNLISDAQNESDLIEAIDNIGFIPPGFRGTDCEGIFAKTMVHCFFNGYLNSLPIPEGYALRDKAEEIIKTAHVMRCTYSISK